MVKPKMFGDLLEFVAAQAERPEFASDPVNFFAGAMTVILFVAAARGVDPSLLLAAGSVIDDMPDRRGRSLA